MISYISGRRLRLVRADCYIYSKRMEELKRQQALDFTMVFWQPSLNFMGMSEHTTLLQGDVIADEEESFLETHKDNAPMLAITRTQQLRLYTIFGEHEKCSRQFTAHGYDWPVVAPAHPMFMEAVFCGGLSSFVMARTTKKRKFRKIAKKAHSTIKGWSKKGNHNVKHHEALLDAESAALDGKNCEAEKKYQLYITTASRGGFVHDAALANERYGEFMYYARSDKEAAGYYFEKAIKLYPEWGAARKVDLLCEQYSHLWTGGPADVISTSHADYSVCNSGLFSALLSAEEDSRSFQVG
jgi:hypothetical protein